MHGLGLMRCCPYCLVEGKGRIGNKKIFNSRRASVTGSFADYVGTTLGLCPLHQFLFDSEHAMPF
jgi:hypothetical protein